MREYPYVYMICSDPDEELFRKSCDFVKKNIPGLVLEDWLEDVDGSTYAYYRKGESVVKVSNDYYIVGVFIHSDIDLSYFLKPC